LKYFKLPIVLLATCAVWLCEGTAFSYPGSWTFLSQTLVTAGSGCGTKPLAFSVYEQISLYSLIAGFVLLFASIFIEKKALKYSLGGLCVLPFLAWAYVNYGVDYQQIRKDIFKHNVQAEATLANIAEAQDRYKSEQGEFIKDIGSITSHLAGSQGLNECVELLSLEVSFEHWSASAKHVSSPETIYWDSTSGSSLKKG
jgi:hypothetical protein